MISFLFWFVAVVLGNPETQTVCFALLVLFGSKEFLFQFLPKEKSARNCKKSAGEDTSAFRCPPASQRGVKASFSPRQFIGCAMTAAIGKLRPWEKPAGQL